jgi:hypothetical protein
MAVVKKPGFSYEMNMLSGSFLVPNTSLTIFSVQAQVFAYPNTINPADVNTFYNASFNITYTVHYTQLDPSGQEIGLLTDVTTSPPPGEGNGLVSMFMSSGNLINFPHSPTLTTLTFVTPTMNFTYSGSDIRYPFGFGSGQHVLNYDAGGGNYTPIADNTGNPYTTLGQWIQNITPSSNDFELRTYGFSPWDGSGFLPSPSRVVIIPQYNLDPPGEKNGNQFKLLFAFRFYNQSSSYRAVTSIKLTFTLNGTTYSDQSFEFEAPLPAIDGGGVYATEITVCQSSLISSPLILDYTLSDLSLRVYFSG